MLGRNYLTPTKDMWRLSCFSILNDSCELMICERLYCEWCFTSESMVQIVPNVSLLKNNCVVCVSKCSNVCTLIAKVQVFIRLPSIDSLTVIFHLSQSCHWVPRLNSYQREYLAVVLVSQIFRAIWSPKDWGGYMMPLSTSVVTASMLSVVRCPLYRA